MEVRYYRSKDGVSPFIDWLASVKDRQGVQKIKARIDRLEEGSLGDYKSSGGGVIELRVQGTGPGFRLYCGMKGQTLIILLVGGDKSSQDRDIKKAQEYWNDYNT